MGLRFTNTKVCFFRFVFVTLTLVVVFSFPRLTVAEETSRQAVMDTLLAMSLEELVEVEIGLATRNLMPVRKAPAIATVITDREIRNMGARTLLDVLQVVPGLGVSIAPIPVAHSIEVRGIKKQYSAEVLIMIDGHSINEAMHSS